jgi:hypothetical protein
VSENETVAEWAKAHEACFEAEPIIEMRGAEKVQAGFLLSLYARVPTELPPGAARREAGTALWERLHEVLKDALQGEEGNVVVDVEPPHTAAVLRPSNKMQPEIALRAQIRHKEGFQPVTAEERQHLSVFEKKLVAAGLRSGHW